MDRKISELFDREFEIQTENQSDLFPPRAIQRRTLQKLHPHTHAVRGGRRTLVLAAACMALLLATASAVGISLFHQRQAQLRQTLQAEPSEQGYQEFAETDGIDLMQEPTIMRRHEFHIVGYVFKGTAPINWEDDGAYYITQDFPRVSPREWARIGGGFDMVGTWTERDGEALYFREAVKNGIMRAEMCQR